MRPDDTYEPPPMTHDELVTAADAYIQNITSDLNSLGSVVGEITDPITLAGYLAALRDVKQDVSRVYDDIERAVIFTAGDRKLEVPSLGVVEIKSSVRRTGWQHDELFRSVISRLADEPGVFYDEDGCLMPSSQIAANVVARLRDVLSPSWKVTGIRDIGLDPDEFCTTDEKRFGVKLPGRNEAA